MTDGHSLLNLTADEVLTTTRSVRKRLDLAKPVERSAIEECLKIAQQAPSASNRQHWHFVVVTDPAKRAGIAALYRRAREMGKASRPSMAFPSQEREVIYERVSSSADYLAEHMHEVPVLVIPCIDGRIEAASYSRRPGASCWQPGHVALARS